MEEMGPQVWDQQWARSWERRLATDIILQDVIGGSDRSAALQLTSLMEGVYTFRLQVVDGQGALDTDTATVEVRPDPRKSVLVELILQVGVGRLTEQQQDTLVRRLAALLNVLDSDVKVQKIQAHSDLSTVIVFYVQSGPPFKVLKAADVVRNLRRRLSKEKADFLLFKVLRIDTAGCLLRCSGHSHCDSFTKRCMCSQLWMENLTPGWGEQLRVECVLRGSVGSHSPRADGGHALALPLLQEMKKD